MRIFRIFNTEMYTPIDLLFFALICSVDGPLSLALAIAWIVWALVSPVSKAVEQEKRS